jgi:hypothetical protein
MSSIGYFETEISILRDRMMYTTSPAELKRIREQIVYNESQVLRLRSHTEQRGSDDAQSA